MDRRGFLKSSSALGAGLVVSFYLPGKEAQAATAGLQQAWLRIGSDDSITILCARSEMGQDTYTSMPLLVAEELEVPMSKVKVEMAPANAALYGNALLGGAQITGGSTSVRDGWVKLRVAGAQAREMLVAAAAQRFGVSPAQCVASNGVVSGGGKSATYGELAEAAGKLKAPEKPALKDASKFKLIGKNVKRLDTPLKVNGKATYGVDVVRPDMLHAALAQCPVIGGTVASVDDSKAKAVKGVVAVVQIPDGVAVVAKDFYSAKKARDLLNISWNNGAGASLSMSSIKAGLREASKKDGAVIKKAGNDANPLNGAAKTLTAEYELPFLAHATLEPPCCTAEIANGVCNVWGPIQFQQGAAGAAAAASGLPAEKVNIYTTFIGGGYGRKLENDYVSQAVAVAKAVGKPVKLIWTREDDITHDFYRPISLQQMSGGLDAKGNLVGLAGKLTSPSVTARAFPPFVANGVDPFQTEGSANITYNVPNMRLANVIQDTGLRVGYWRSVSNALNAFAIESFMDELAHAAGKDPVAFRNGLLSTHPRAQKVLKLAAQKAGWGKAKAGRSLGIAQMECYDSYAAVVAEVSVKKGEIQVHRLVCAVDCGLAVRPDQVKAQMESGLLLGYSAAMKNQITVDQGRVQQSNFHDYPLLRMAEAPKVEVHLLEGADKPAGMGEVGVPLAAPAIANAVFAATGKRMRSLPLQA